MANQETPATSKRRPSGYEHYPVQTIRNIINDLSTIPSVKHSTFSQLFRTNGHILTRQSDSFQRYHHSSYIHLALKRYMNKACPKQSNRLSKGNYDKSEMNQKKDID